MKPVKIVWLDATSLSGHLDKQQAVDSSVIERVNYGLIVDETERDITIVSGVLKFPKEEYNNALTIPRGCIEEIIELQEVKHD
jgi:hypothetical protein